MGMAQQHNGPSREPKMFRTLQDDLLHGDFAGSFKRDFREAREYMIDEERRQRLSRMKGVGRWFYTIWWMLSSMFF